MENARIDRPWLNTAGGLLSDSKLKEVSKSWSQDDWNKFLDETVDVGCDYQSELLQAEEYAQKIENMTETIWEATDSHSLQQISKHLRELCRDHLTPRQQQIIRLYYWDGISERTIAEVLDIGRSTVALQKRRSLNKLKTLLVKRYQTKVDDRFFLMVRKNKGLHFKPRTKTPYMKGKDNFITLKNEDKRAELKSVYDAEIEKRNHEFRGGPF